MIETNFLFDGMIYFFVSSKLNLVEPNYLFPSTINILVEANDFILSTKQFLV
jgi:hypothetical protein